MTSWGPIYPYYLILITNRPKLVKHLPGELNTMSINVLFRLCFPS